MVTRYQTTSHTPEALERLVEAYLTLGLVEEAKRNASVLGYNFPGDIWYADAYRLMTDKGYRPAVDSDHDRQTSRRPCSITPPKPSPWRPPPPVQPETTAQAAAAAPADAAATPAPAKKKKGWFSWPFGG